MRLPRRREDNPGLPMSLHIHPISHHRETILKKYEKHIKSFSSFNEAIGKLNANVGAIRLVWRGQANAKWGIHSGLYRALLKKMA